MNCQIRSRFASAAAISVFRLGARTSAPTRQEIKQRLNEILDGRGEKHG